MLASSSLPCSLADINEASSYYFLPKNPAPPLPTDQELAVETIRRDFPALHQQINGRPLIWLDNAATTQKPQSVIDAVTHFYSQDNSNVHRGAHTLAKRATDAYEGAREKVMHFIGANSVEEIIFVRSATEAINLVAQSYGRRVVGPGDEIIVSILDHHANIVPWQLLCEEKGATLRVIPVNNNAEIIVEEYEKLLNSKTRFIAIPHVSNSLGTVVPIKIIIDMAHSLGIPVLVDGAQGIPHFKTDVQELGADFYAFSGHKLFGPTGIGVLYGKKSLLEEIPPWQGGGNMIKNVTFEHTTFNSLPNKFEAGTGHIAGAVGLGAAIDYLTDLGLAKIEIYEKDLMAYATETLCNIPKLHLIGTAAHKAAILSFVVQGVPSGRIAEFLDRQGIAVRVGHHCAQPSLRRFGLDSTIRPSIAFYNTFAEIDELVWAIQQSIR
ncbi:cysteine desulfurase [Pelorhabdus rhamnosifermentans]|uniref:cysteine desulfurase n=1 Tax=Pelorhabdus rhamnosifermentans TaxID=2772457 RepID=UPI001C064711|nr:cysteine desulfurase [Pelorhabdus rhamnosifermentans]